jgi:cytochrome c oxidase accessory protein FixG
MCPWPRIQAALTDEWALNVMYRRDRGEPRMSVKKAEHAREAGQPAGDCVDCNQCVAVCPTGVDIRKGSQLGCVQCGLCIDACDTVMRQIGRPERLIAYDTDINMARRAKGEAPIYRIVRPRTVLYAAVIAIVGAVMLATLATRSSMSVKVLHDRNPLFTVLSDGGVRNDYTVRFLNKYGTDQSYALTIEGLPRAAVDVAGADATGDGRLVVTVGPDQTREVRMRVAVPESSLPKAPVEITFTVVDIATGESASAREHFIPR